jgi:hypothetical protein
MMMASGAVTVTVTVKPQSGRTVGEQWENEWESTLPEHLDFVCEVRKMFVVQTVICEKNLNRNGFT